MPKKMSYNELIKAGLVVEIDKYDDEDDDEELTSKQLKFLNLFLDYLKRSYPLGDFSPATTDEAISYWTPILKECLEAGKTVYDLGYIDGKDPAYSSGGWV